MPQTDTGSITTANCHQLGGFKYLLLSDNSQMGPQTWTLACLRHFKLHVSQIESTISMVFPIGPPLMAHLGKERICSSSWSHELHCPRQPVWSAPVLRMSH